MKIKGIKPEGKRLLKRIVKILVFILIVIIILLAGIIAVKSIIKGISVDEKGNVAVEISGFDEKSQKEEKKEVETKKETSKVKENTETSQEVVNPSKKEEAITAKKPQAKGYFNSFAGYTSAIVANGGLTTQEGSYYAQAGIDVSIKIEDNDDAIIEAFKNGEINFFYMTVNKMSLVCKELEDAGIDVIIPYLSDSSTGGDGIVAKSQYQSIESLKYEKRIWQNQGITINKGQATKL